MIIYIIKPFWAFFNLTMPRPKLSSHYTQRMIPYSISNSHFCTINSSYLTWGIISQIGWCWDWSVNRLPWTSEEECVLLKTTPLCQMSGSPWLLWVHRRLLIKMKPEVQTKCITSFHLQFMHLWNNDQYIGQAKMLPYSI